MAMKARPTQQFLKGQTIVVEGALGDRSYKILSGEVVVCKRNRKMALVPIAKLGPGDMFGEMYLFDGKHARSATVVAASAEVQVEIYFEEELQGLIGRTSMMLANILKGATSRLKTASQGWVEATPSGAPSVAAIKLPNATPTDGVTVHRLI